MQLNSDPVVSMSLYNNKHPHDISGPIKKQYLPKL